MQVLSPTNPGIQAEKDAKRAVTHARKVNDFLKTVIEKHPTRFGGFAALALQDPKAAADELERTVKQYGFSGALINGPRWASTSTTPASTLCGSGRPTSTSRSICTPLSARTCRTSSRVTRS